MNSGGMVRNQKKALEIAADALLQGRSLYLKKQFL